MPGQDPIRIVIMNNVFETSLNITQRFDLKGSTRNRLCSEEEIQSMGKNPVLKDLNFKDKIYLGSLQKKAVTFQILKDTEFLQRNNVMDFSLLLGIHDSGKERVTELEFVPRDLSGDLIAPKDQDGLLSIFQQVDGGIASSRDSKGQYHVYFIGIIDILQEFNLKKKLEFTYKSVRFNKDAISAVETSQYVQRFRQYCASKLK